MYRINDQTVLEEDYDENYQPTDEGLDIYCALCIVMQIDILIDQLVE